MSFPSRKGVSKHFQVLFQMTTLRARTWILLPHEDVAVADASTLAGLVSFSTVTRGALRDPVLAICSNPSGISGKGG